MSDIRDSVVLSPAPVLKTNCTPIDEITPEIKALADHMLNVMYGSDGCGLAAPQVGESLRMIVVDCDYVDEKTHNPYVLINPEIIVADGELRVTGEGCLSFPGITVPVERPSHVVVRARNLEGQLMQYEARDNLLAVCLQHEIDHINGVTMIDHVGPRERAELLAQYKEALEQGARPGDVGSSRD